MAQSNSTARTFVLAGIVIALGAVLMLIMGSSTFLAICSLVGSACLFFIAWSKSRKRATSN